MEEEQSTNSLAMSNNDGIVTRPKLKKIKRPKIRPSVDNPVPPSKIEPEEVSSLDVPNTPLPDDNVPTTGTELITPGETQDIIRQHEVNSNPYVIDGLPPELEYISEEGDIFDDSEQTAVSPSKLKIVGLVCLVVGLFIGRIFFSSSAPEQHGLEGVVLNPEVPAGRPRCGLTEETQPCVLYLMNCYKQELTSRNFYQLAAQLTKREEYMIETENFRYANEKIRPGQFVQLNIPALK